MTGVNGCNQSPLLKHLIYSVFGYFIRLFERTRLKNAFILAFFSLVRLVPSFETANYTFAMSNPTVHIHCKTLVILRT